MLIEIPTHIMLVVVVGQSSYQLDYLASGALISEDSLHGVPELRSSNELLE